MWRQYFLLCVLNPLPGNCVRCSLVPGLWAVVVNLSRLALLWLNMVAKFNLPHIPPLPAFVQAEVWPVSQLLCRGHSLLGHSHELWCSQCFLFWGEKGVAGLHDIQDMAWKKKHGLEKCCDFSPLISFPNITAFMMPDCNCVDIFREQWRTVLHRISQYPVVLHSSLEVFSQYP